MYGRRVLILCSISLGLGLVLVGVVQAAGNNGACGGQWTEVYDPQTDTWSYDTGSFTCVGECGGPACLKRKINEHPDGSKDKLCGCWSETLQDYVFDWVYINGHEPAYACDAVAHYGPGQSVETATDCHPTRCADEQKDCNKYVFSAYYWGGTWCRDYQCKCQ